MAQPADQSPSYVLRAHGRWTADDLSELPEGNRYEIIDGGLFVSPMADKEHQWIAARVWETLAAAAPPGWTPFPEINVAAGTSVLIPDATVLRPNTDLRVEPTDPAGVALVVEVESRSSRRHDRFTKPSLYAEVGIESYWRVERTDAGPAVHLYRLTEAGTYHLEHSVAPGERREVTLPYPLVVEPGTWALPGA
jgi:Uma2 family endonuclease